LGGYEEKESTRMLEPPDVQDAQIIACLEAAYGLSITEIVFLPLGADMDTAVYRVVADDTTQYFLKLRRGLFPEVTVTIPHWLARKFVCRNLSCTRRVFTEHLSDLVTPSARTTNRSITVPRAIGVALGRTPGPGSRPACGPRIWPSACDC
jgi:hypothetical protein